MTDTNVIVASPNVEGNIGSCEVKTTKNMTYDGYLTGKYEVISVNSCNGEIVRQYEYISHRSTISSIFTILVVVLVLAFFVKHALLRN